MALTCLRIVLPGVFIKHGHLNVFMLFFTDEKRNAQVKCLCNAFVLLNNERFLRFRILIEKNIKHLVFCEKFKQQLNVSNGIAIIGYAKEITENDVFMASWLVGIAQYNDAMQKYSQNEAIMIAYRVQRDFLTHISSASYVLEWFDRYFQHEKQNEGSGSNPKTANKKHENNAN